MSLLLHAYESPDWRRLLYWSNVYIKYVCLLVSFLVLPTSTVFFFNFVFFFSKLLNLNLFCLASAGGAIAHKMHIHTKSSENRTNVHITGINHWCIYIQGSFVVSDMCQKFFLMLVEQWQETRERVLTCVPWDSDSGHLSPLIVSLC